MNANLPKNILLLLHLLLLSALISNFISLNVFFLNSMNFASRVDNVVDWDTISIAHVLWIEKESSANWKEGTSVQAILVEMEVLVRKVLMVRVSSASAELVTEEITAKR